jgi:hypothetical protein
MEALEAQDIKTIDSYCRNCIYRAMTAGKAGDKFCAYILIEEKCRPCPAGTGCTVRKIGKRIDMRKPLEVVRT